ncbi:MAG: hypothetical protein VB081_08320 [Christensenella sp.]|uniref:hypothetical protein n=1 Tax=Christensenella sp. TaxID=1935934 RepID=UPI002B1FCFB0|nr:hypothetical protein [Christensenella sp.]MEA5003488.1 hypothetical protein [Christensenella sp.]
MVSLRRHEVMKTLSTEMFSEARRLLGKNRILCDYSVVYHDRTCGNREVRYLYVHDNDYREAYRILHTLGYVQ